LFYYIYNDSNIVLIYTGLEKIFTPSKQYVTNLTNLLKIKLTHDNNPESRIFDPIVWNIAFKTNGIYLEIHSSMPELGYLIKHPETREKMNFLK
jgi:hypothetical protein